MRSLLERREDDNKLHILGILSLDAFRNILAFKI